MATTEDDIGLNAIELDDDDFSVEGFGFFNKIVRAVTKPIADIGNVVHTITKPIVKPISAIPGVGNIVNIIGKPIIGVPVGILQKLKVLPTARGVVQAGAASANVRCNLATAYGNLNKESLKKMDKEMKVIIGYTIQQLNKLGTLTWDNVLRCMNGNKLLVTKPGTTIHRSDGISKSGTGIFKTDGGPNNSTVREIDSWFRRLISDANVIADTGIDINVLGRMVAESGAGINNIGAFFYRKVNKSKNVMDVSVLRFPDLDKPYFQVYRIRLNAWRRCERVLFFQKDRSGINGDYNSQSYSPTPEKVRELTQSVIDQAVNEAEDLFN